MRVHNLVKDLVVQKVEEIFSSSDLASVPPDDPGTKMDIICFVLNRIPPQYVVSGRGMAYSESQDYQQKIQRLADITRLVKEGLEMVRMNRRDRTNAPFNESKEGRFFNFPSFIGRLFDGANFAPLHDLEVSLLHEGKLLRVIDPNWQNPYKLVTNTAGTYLFWPHPIPALDHETQKTFHLEIAVEDPRWDPLHYHVEITLNAESDFVDFIDTRGSFRIKDLYLFPREDLPIA
ncbi:MAG: late competence development ComFB family protein [Spirochaetales bacterium]|nr:late competence development ComFB family protein [Spirochaetales bacterium]